MQGMKCYWYNSWSIYIKLITLNTKLLLFKSDHLSDHLIFVKLARTSRINYVG